MSVIIFVVLRLLPGNAVTAAMGVSEGLLTKAQVAALDRYYGVGQPVIQQYWSWLHSLLQGNLGISLASREPVSTLIGTALPVTLGVGPLRHGDRHRHWGGLWRVERAASRALAGRHRTRYLGHRPRYSDLHSRDRARRLHVRRSFTTFLRRLPFVGFFTNPWLNFQQIIFPALVLSLGIGAAILRTTRAAVLEVSNLNFARTALGKGVSRRAFIWRHLFLNALTAVTTMSGIQLGYLLGGTVIIEQIFILPGMGRLLITSIANRDFPVVQSVVLIFAAGFVIVNMLVDLFYTVIDPRTRPR